jgi:hypothetical protein
MIVNVYILGVKISNVKFIFQVLKYVYDTLNVLFTSHLDSRLMVFDKTNNFFYLTYKLGNVTTFCPFIFKNSCSFYV